MIGKLININEFIMELHHYLEKKKPRVRKSYHLIDIPNGPSKDFSTMHTSSLATRKLQSFITWGMKTWHQSFLTAMLIYCHVCLHMPIEC